MQVQACSEIPRGQSLFESLLVFENAGKATSRGVELELAGKIVKGIEGRVSYSLQKTTDSATGIPLSNSPRNLLS